MSVLLFEWRFLNFSATWSDIRNPDPAQISIYVFMQLRRIPQYRVNGYIKLTSIIGNNRWGPAVLYAKILTVINQVITIRIEAKWTNAKIVKLRDFFHKVA